LKEWNAPLAIESDSVLQRLLDRRSRKRPAQINAEERLVWALNRVLDAIARYNRDPFDALARTTMLARFRELRELRQQLSAHTLACHLVPRRPKVGRPSRKKAS
jgi:hypothetical protein